MTLILVADHILSTVSDKTFRINFPRLAGFEAEIQLATTASNGKPPRWHQPGRLAPAGPQQSGLRPGRTGWGVALNACHGAR